MPTKCFMVNQVSQACTHCFGVNHNHPEAPGCEHCDSTGKQTLWFADDGRSWPEISDLPAGAMFYYGDEKHLFVICPGTAAWDIDAKPAGGGEGWKRTGTPPNVTATPSIFCDPPYGYHGFLKDGELTDNLNIVPPVGTLSEQAPVFVASPAHLRFHL